ncbi:MAG: Type 1 glutamine amidotransferase-like domain-containing protein [Anaerolineae bacterium]|nr:Type 1 glutamine amidotransferase-like domain-containing protein [Thermoflexus sp.]MDW8064628.1 Type 1 glutamine amidotransferase-like domain-containing protein [Anaerolineae bacterium]
MGQKGPLRWRGGYGWLVLCGGEQAIEAHRMALARTAMKGYAVVVMAAADDPERARRYERQYRTWGDLPCHVLTLHDREEALQSAHARLLLGARLILIADGDVRRLLKTFFDTPALQAMLTAYHSGAVVLGIGAGAEAMGTWVLQSSWEETLGAWGWLPGAFVVSHYTPKAARALQAALHQRPFAYGIGLAEGAALALGPGDQIERWGEGEITLVFGACWLDGKSLC